MGEMIVVTDETDYDVLEQANPAEIAQNSGATESQTQPIRSLTRLLVGGTLEGWDELWKHIKSWEADVEVARQQHEIAPSNAEAAPPPVETMRYAVIGLMFNVQDRFVQRGKVALNIAGQTTNAFLSPAARRLDANPRLRPVRSRFDKLVTRGEAVASQWVDRGRQEEVHSRKLVRQAAQEGFNSSMDQLGQAPALQDLVRKQSAGLTQDVVDEVRARTVSADILAENLARSVLRRTPRRDLPSPETTSSEE